VEPDAINILVAGISALFVGMSSIAAVAFTHHNNKQNRKQLKLIADEQALALRLQASETAKIATQAHEIKVSIDGRMDELLNTVRELATAKAQAIAVEEAAKVRDDTIATNVADAVVKLIDQKVDIAVNTIPVDAIS